MWKTFSEKACRTASSSEMTGRTPMVCFTWRRPPMLTPFIWRHSISHPPIPTLIHMDEDLLEISSCLPTLQVFIVFRAPIICRRCFSLLASIPIQTACCESNGTFPSWFSSTITHPPYPVEGLTHQLWPAFPTHPTPMAKAPKQHSLLAFSGVLCWRPRATSVHARLQVRLLSSLFLLAF